jgi:hypothetical protein
MLRPGSVGSFTAADHIAVLDAALAQIPPGHRDDLLVAVDGAGASNDLVDHLTGLNTTAVRGRRGRIETVNARPTGKTRSESREKTTTQA